MKLNARQIDPFLKNPDPAARVILIYGPDGGLVKERARLIGLTVTPDLNDPFNVAVMSSDMLGEDPARLMDEANAISMMGGRRLIRIEDAADKITVLIKDYLANPNDNALIVLEAAELNARSSLRTLCEKSPAAAALPCYVEDERDLARFIRETMKEARLEIEPDAVTWLAGHIGGNRMKARGELEKLITYMGEQGTVTLPDVLAICGEAGAQGLDDLVYNIGARNSAGAMRVFDQLMQEDVAFIMILRALQNHFRRLHLVRAKMESGDSLDSAVKSLSPPIFFKQEPLFRAQVQNWSLAPLGVALQRLMDIEAQCKQTGAPAETLCAQAVLGLSAMRG